MRQAALRYGVPSNKIVLHGLPIRPAFSLDMKSKPELRKALGLLPDKPAVLVVGGGEGMGPVEKQARGWDKRLLERWDGNVLCCVVTRWPCCLQVRALAKVLGPKGQVVVICGRNQALVNKLKGLQYPEGMKVSSVHAAPLAGRASRAR